MSMKIKICGCGRQTFDASGLCTICRMDGGVLSKLQDVQQKKEEVVMAEKDIGKGDRACGFEGCNKYIVTGGFCVRHFKEQHSSGETIAQNKLPGEKVCVDCSQVYTPTSNVQKRCVHCKGRLQTAKNKNRVSHPKPLEAIKPSEAMTGAAASEPGGNSSKGLLFDRLMVKKFALETDLFRINTAIDVIREVDL